MISHFVCPRSLELKKLTGIVKSLELEVNEGDKAESSGEIDEAWVDDIHQIVESGYRR